jgi:hypothetical protein
MIRKSPTGRLTSWHPPLHQLPPTDEQVKRIIAAWRARHPKIVALWVNIERRTS